MKSLLIFSHALFFLSLFSENASGFYNSAFQEAIEKLRPAVSDDEIYKWWFRKRADELDHPRTFPICYNVSLRLPGNVNLFLPAFQSIGDLKEYNPKVSGWVDGRKGTPYESMDYKRISIKRSNTASAPFGGVEGKNPFELQQWASFTVKFNRPVRALYVQSVGGPLGIPIGEFSTDFRCTESEVDDKDYLKHASVEPCHYSPRAVFTWPHVFIYYTGNISAVDKIQFRYRWTEGACVETGFVQFVLIVTDDFEVFYPILSPIFRFVNLDSIVAVPSPYYQYYDSIRCGLDPTNQLEQNIMMIDNETRILPNVKYDECIVNGAGMITSGRFKDTCPPGYFRCSQDWTNNAEWKNITETWFRDIVTAPIEECCQLKQPMTPLPVPPAPTGPPANQSVESINEIALKERTLHFEKQVKITHGDYCILVWLVIVPIANHAARFFKDFGVISRVGLGFWIILHITLHSFGLILVWWSFGLVVGGGDDKLGNVGGLHLFLGLVSTGIQHSGFVTGIQRSENERRTFRMVLNHSILGYISQFLTCMEVILSNAGAVRKYVSCGLGLACMVVGGIFYCVEQRQDQILGVVPRRAQCPVLQEIVVVGGRPPLGNLKIQIMVFLCLLNGGIFAFMVIMYPSSEVVKTD